MLDNIDQMNKIAMKKVQKVAEKGKSTIIRCPMKILTGLLFQLTIHYSSEKGVFF